MKAFLFLAGFLFSTGMFAQEFPFAKVDAEILFSGDKQTMSSNKQILELTGNVSFTTDIVAIEKADKIVYDSKNKTFTISGFKELRINGEKQLAEDLGPTTLRIRVGDSVAYLVAVEQTCPDGKNRDC